MGLSFTLIGLRTWGQYRDGGIVKEDEDWAWWARRPDARRRLYSLGRRRSFGAAADQAHGADAMRIVSAHPGNDPRLATGASPPVDRRARAFSARHAGVRSDRSRSGHIDPLRAGIRWLPPWPRSGPIVPPVGRRGAPPEPLFPHIQTTPPGAPRTGDKLSGLCTPYAASCRDCDGITGTYGHAPCKQCMTLPGIGENYLKSVY